MDDEFDFDSEWFFDELKNQGQNDDIDTGLNLNVPTTPPASSSNDHGISSSSNPQIQQQQPSHQSNNYQEQQMGHMDGMMPSTSTYGLSSQTSHIQEQQIPVSQHQQHQMQVNQQQFQTLQTYNPNQQNQNNYQQNSQQMSYDMGMEFEQNEATTSNSMPMECRISQEFSSQQYQQQNDNQWIESSSQINQQQMTSVVYASTSQQMPRIPDPGGHNQSQQMLNNYNSQQLIQTGMNGETILTNMQPVQHLQRIISQPPPQHQQQFDNYIQQPIAYIDHGSQQFITQQSTDINNPNFHPSIMQVIPPGIPTSEAPLAAPAPPQPKQKAKNASRANGRRKNQAPPADESSILKIKSGAAITATSLDFGFRLSELSQRRDQEEQGLNRPEVMADLNRQLGELLMNNSISLPSAPPPPPPQKPIPIAPTPAPVSQPKGKKGRTKAEVQQSVQQKRAAATNSTPSTSANISASQQQQSQPPQNCRIVSQEANYIIVESNGQLMKAVNVKTENGTATYQILGPVDNPPTPQTNNIRTSQQSQKRPQPIKPAPLKSEADDLSQAAISEVVDSFSSSNNKSKTTAKKTPAKSKSKKVSEPSTFEQKPTAIKQPESTVICVPSTSKEPPKPKIVFPPKKISAKRIKDKTESRRRRISDFIKTWKESIATADINSSFIDKEDVLKRLVPYGFHYEPNISEKTMDKYEHELVRHQTHNFDRYKNIEAKMQQIFIRDTTKQSYDLDIDMLLAIDAEYERKELEKDKALFQQDPYKFIRESDILKTGTVTSEYITEMKNKLNQNKPKTLPKPVRGFVFEPSHFDEEEFIKRKQKCIEEIEEEERREKQAAYRKAHPPPPPPKPPKPIQMQTPKLTIKPPIEQPSVKINLTKLQENSVPVKETVKLTKKPIAEFTSSSESSTSEDDDEDYSKNASKSKKSKSFRSISPQKDRKSKSPQKGKQMVDISKEKIKPNLDKFNHKPQQLQPPLKTTIRKPMPPEHPFYPKMDLGNFKIPRIGEIQKPPQPPSFLPLIKQEPAKIPEKVQPVFVEAKQKELVKSHDSPAVKENVIETLKIKKSAFLNNSDIIHKKKKKHHHHHHHHSKHDEKSNNMVSNHVTQKLSLNLESNESPKRLEGASKVVPSLIIKSSIFKAANEHKKEENISKEAVKAEDKSLKSVLELQKTKAVTPELLPSLHQPLKIKIKPFIKPDSPAVSSNIDKESLMPTSSPKSQNNSMIEHKKKDKKDKHHSSKESRKSEKKAKEEEDAPPKLIAVETNQTEDEAAKEAKKKKKEEKKRRKAEKEQRKLDKKEQKQKIKDEEATKATRIQSPGGDPLKIKLSFKKPVKEVEEQPEMDIPPPPQLQPESIETTPKLKFTIPRNMLPESSKKAKKEKDRSLKRESPKFESEPNLEAPPPKIPRVKIKLPKNPEEPSSSVPPLSLPSSPAPSIIATINPSSVEVPTERKNSTTKIMAIEKQVENSENKSSNVQENRPRMTGQPPTASVAVVQNVGATTAPKIKKMKKSKHGKRSGFSDCSDVEEANPVSLRLMTDRILSRCRD